MRQFRQHKYSLFMVVVTATVLSISLLLLFNLTMKPTSHTPPKSKAINSFEQCVANGNPVMESYPRQCMHEGHTFFETIE